MKALLLTNEYPPDIYGGAGIHVEYLSRELSKLCQVDVRCFGNQNVKQGALTATGYPLDDHRYTCPGPLKHAFGAMQRCIDFNTINIDADLVHVHTWYTHFGGILAKLNYSIPLVLTTHSLEPLRPWKREQLASGYNCSSWIEKTAIEMADAVVAVSQETKNDILKLFNVEPNKIHIIHNGIDLDEYRPTEAPEVLKKYGVDPAKPYLLFVGRVTRQKGIIHLVNALHYMDNDFQVVLCAGAPDTPEIGREMQDRVAAIQKKRDGVIWIQEMLDLPSKVAFYSHAAVFCCPSVYEPFGIINLEAMACETPVVASAVGGIKEVVVDGQTGLLIHLTLDDKGALTPASAEKFERDIEGKVDLLMKDTELRAKMGKAARRRAIDHFSWTAIAKQTYELYGSLV